MMDENKNNPAEEHSTLDSEKTGEVRIEIVDSESAAPRGAALEQELRTRIAELEDKLLRTAAEYENSRRRMARLADDAARSAVERLLFDLLEIVDNFERALAHAGEGEADTPLRQGTDLIYGQLTQFLRRQGVEPIDSVGTPFNPELHEALMQVESTDFAEGVVAVEMARGYRIGERILRHARVGVSRGAATGAHVDNDNKIENE